jgi:hypothetical protein
MDVSCSYPPRYFLRVLVVDFNQKIIDLKGTFERVWDNELGEAYLFTKDYDMAIEILENSQVISYHQGLFLAFAYLKVGDRKKFEVQLDKWISENCELYKQYYIRHEFDDEDFEDDDFEIPAKLNRAQFEVLSSEYCYLDRKFMFSIDEITEEEESKYFELKDLLFADITIG